MGLDQCVCFINKCRTCQDYRYKPNDLICPHCGTKRPRCGAKAAPGVDVCRAHNPRGVLSIHNLAAGRISEQAIEEVMETDSRSVDAEVALGRLLLTKILESEDPQITDRQKLKAIREYLELHTVRKQLETGDDLHIKMEDKTAEAIRRRFKMLIAAFAGALKEAGVPEDKTREIMDKVRTASKLAGKYTPAGHGPKPPDPLPGVRSE